MSKNTNIEELDQFHQLCMHNKDALKKVKIVGCFACGAIYASDKITDYVDLDNDTAICPYCNVDSVIPLVNQSFEEKKDLLVAMSNYYFQ